MKVEIKPIDTRSVWEDFVERVSPGALFQSWLWGDVQKKLGVSLWRLGTYEADVLIGIAQIVKISARRGSFLHVRHGPIFTNPVTAPWRSWLEAVRETGRREKVLFIRISPLIDDTKENNAHLREFGFRPAAIHAMDAEHCWVLDLDIPEAELLSNMRKTTRYEIRRAEKLGIVVNISDQVKDLKPFFELYKKTASRHGFVPHTGIQEEFEVFSKERQALVFTATHEGMVLASAIVLFTPGQAIYHHGASVSTKLPASCLVQWEAIKEAKKRNIKVYNFWGIAQEDKLNHPWRGITLFKKGFGGREINTIHAQDLSLSPLYAVPRGIETFRRVLKGY